MVVGVMETADFDYDLPAAAIAQVPVEPRDAARLLVDRGPGQAPDHRHVRDLPSLVGAGDLVVVNTTRVLPARLRTTRDTGGAAEVLLLEPVDGEPDTWEALVRPSRKLAPGTDLEIGDDLRVIVGEDLGEGRRIVEVVHPLGSDLLDVLERHGEVPLPPYITTPLEDPERYQTTYADEPGSVAAPTAGLHLTAEVLQGLADAGAELATVELVVGLGTFKPIATDRVEDHRMHAERYRVPQATVDACAAAARVVAVGTTTVRALESVAATGELEGRTDLFIHGDHRFALVDALVTNFHQPRSSLLVLVDAFVGPRWRDLYAAALAAGYRFLSFGDAMFLRGERG
ncbi:MAG TPA: tRNA preQ1(34) S-adenosylmethionine ribosyltransferase-isomerase QueA [Acidimicrobiales bacterium]|nr:tRNA preQ1(34) S-adenosylmethionine ribosyltransferase-isomerase QueA [Acidimicrobiales bacterium]